MTKSNQHPFWAETYETVEWTRVCELRQINESCKMTGSEVLRSGKERQKCPKANCDFSPLTKALYSCTCLLIWSGIFDNLPKLITIKLSLSFISLANNLFSNHNNWTFRMKMSILIIFNRSIKDDFSFYQSQLRAQHI